MKKRLLSVILAGVLTLSFVACGDGSAAEKTENIEAGNSLAEDTKTGELTTVRVAIMTGGASHWYAVIGDKEGIFEKHGIKAEVTEFAAGINTVDAVVTGQADFGNLADYAAVNRIGNTKENTNLVLVDRISTSKGTSNGGLYVSEDIKSVEDLAGQPFSTQPGTVWDYWLAKTYEYANIPEADQNIVEVDSPASAVALQISGDVKAQWASGTNGAKLEDAGFSTILTLDELGLYTDAYYVSTSDYVNANPEVVKEWIAAQKDIADWIDANKDQAAADWESVSGESQEQFLASLAGTKLVADFPQETLEHLNGVKDWAVNNGRFDDYDILDFTDLTALKAALPEADTID